MDDEFTCLLCCKFGQKPHYLAIEGNYVSYRLCLDHNFRYFTVEGFYQFGADHDDLLKAYRSISPSSD